MPAHSRPFALALVLGASPSLAQIGAPPSAPVVRACTLQEPIATTSHVVQLSARGVTAAGVVNPPATSDAERQRLAAVLRAVQGAVVKPTRPAFVPVPGTDFFLAAALTATPDSVANPLVRGRVLFVLHADGRVSDVRVVRQSVFPSLDSAVATALARLGTGEALAALAAPDRAAADSIALALDLTSDVDGNAVQAPVFTVAMPQFLARAVVPRSRVRPRYPTFLLANRMEGVVMTRFVVDEAGRADSATITVLRHSHPEFAQSVLDIMPKLRFTPAVAGGCPVRLQVQQPFSFTR